MKSKRSRNKTIPNKSKHRVLSRETTARITNLGCHGDGVGSLENAGEGNEGGGSARCFVPFALPGEVVRVSVSGRNVSLLEVLEVSASRVDPFCPHFTRCGGCTVQHLSADAYRDWKRNIVVTALANKGLDVTVGELIDAHGSGRRRISLHARSMKSGWKAGFMVAGSHQIIDLDHCAAAVPVLQDVAPLASALAGAFVDKGKDLDIRITETAEGLDCDIIGVKAEDYDTLAELAEIAETRDLARVSVGGDTIVERRRPWLLMGSVRITPPPGGFLQATTLGEETLASLVQDFVGRDANHIADLFCGIGSFALRLAQGAPVYGADCFDASVDALDVASRHASGLKPITAESRNLFKNPLSEVELKPFDVVVFNPPRAGAEAQSRELVTSSVSRVVAVSCDLASFARDAEILCGGGYRLEKITPVDQFKWSSHVEVVALFTRRTPTRI